MTLDWSILPRRWRLRLPTGNASDSVRSSLTMTTMKLTSRMGVDVVASRFCRELARGKKIGIVSGSFDPITLGHVWIIERALEIVDYVVVAIAHNSTKKYLFDEYEREQLVRATLREKLID